MHAKDKQVLPWNEMLEMEEEDEEIRSRGNQSELLDVETRQGPPSPIPPPCPSSFKTTKDGVATRHRRRISFGQVRIVRFWPQLGDHPAVSSGCPIALGEPIAPQNCDNLMDVFDMDLYEATRPSHQRRSSHQLRIPAEERTRILLTMGHTKREIVGQARDIHMLRESRRRTARQKQLEVYYGALVRRVGGAHGNVQTTIV
jgi:hypothetical protein